MKERVLVLLRLIVFPVWILAGLSVHSLPAQDSGVSGRILDSSRAAVGRARVTLTRVDTGERRQTISNKEGYYAFPLLLPGKYQLRVEKEGFAIETETGISVETATISTVEVKLSVGSLSQSISVTAHQSPLQVGSSAIAHVVENQAIEGLPLIDRRSEQLTRLNGFVVENGAGSSTTFAIAGGRGNNANYYVDGGNAQNMSLGVPQLVFDPPVEAMQEFNIALSDYSAELGRSGGSVTQITTRSGSNRFHGSVYEYFRNDVLDTRTFFSPTNPTLRYNLFGGSLGGPIRKDKTQFFFNYEGRREKSPMNRVLSVPTEEEVQGDFSADGHKVDDPSACTTGNPPVCKAFPDNIIPPQRFDPVGAKLAAFYPAPNVAGAKSDAADFVANEPIYSPYDSYVGRIDHILTENDRLFGRLLAQTDHMLDSPIFPVPGTDRFGELLHDYYYNFALAWNHVFSGSTINEFRYAYTRRQFLDISAGANTTIDQQIGLKGVNTSFFPTVNVQGLAQLGLGYQQRLQTPVLSDQYADIVTQTRGNHQVKFGFEYRYGSNLDVDSPAAGGAFVFSSQLTNSSLASLLLGRVLSASLIVSEPLHTRSDSYATFVQDDWRATSHLTLNLGLRWDADAPRWDTNNRQNSFDRTAINPVSRSPGVVLFSGMNGVSKYANDWDLNNFGPRIGFAWKLGEHWVARGGGAILYPGEYDSATPMSAYLGFSTAGSFVSPNNGITPAFTLANGMPPVSTPTEADLTPGFGAVPAGQMPSTAVQFFERRRRTGYLYQASLDIQHQLEGNWLLDIAYLGTFGHHLASPDPQSINQVPPDKLTQAGAESSQSGKTINTQVLRPFPQYSNVQVIAADIGNSNYNALNLGIDKRYSEGLSLMANYTYSQFIDNVDARNELADYPGVNAFTNYYDQRADKGRSGNDITHRFVLGSIYDLPVGVGRPYVARSAFANQMLGGWTVGLIAEVRSGTPLSPIELTNNTFSFSDGVRPDVVGNPNLPGSRLLSQRLAEWFNVNAFSVPGPFTFGNAGRTFGEGPGAISVDASLLKNFNVREKAALEFRAEVLNFLNHPNFANPDTRQGSSTFGQITSLVQGNQSRIIQLGLHLRF